MSHAKHKGLHHLSSQSHDSHGWVEGITSLKEDDKATELLAEAVAKASLHAAAPAGNMEAAKKVCLLCPGLGSCAWQRVLM